MNKETLRMQMLAGVITEGEYAAAINKEVEETEKDSLNEHVIGGIVGIGAINQIPSRAKADYEDAFEHFLGERYQVKPNRERDDIKDINEEEEVEEGNLYPNELASLESEGRFWVVSWRGMDGPKEKVFTDEDEARVFMDTLEEGKEVEEPSLYEGEEEELDEAGKPGTFKERSAMAKKARAGKDIGEKGKNFEKIAKSAAKKYGSEEAGKKVAGAVMYGKLNK